MIFAIHVWLSDNKEWHFDTIQSSSEEKAWESSAELAERHNSPARSPYILVSQEAA